MILRLTLQSFCELTAMFARALKVFVVLGLAALDGWLVWLDAAIAAGGGTQ